MPLNISESILKIYQQGLETAETEIHFWPQPPAIRPNLADMQTASESEQIFEMWRERTGRLHSEGIMTCIIHNTFHH